MNPWQRDVTEFHDRFHVAIGMWPNFRDVTLRGRLIGEEIRELATAIESGDMVETADAIVDSIYVLVGTAVTFGIDLGPIWDAVHAANMAKVGGGMRDDGKVLKPTDWEAPEIARLLIAQGWIP